MSNRKPILAAFGSCARSRVQALCAVAALAAAPFAHAIESISDPANDFLATFAGSTRSTDLDVLGATVTYNSATDTFVLSSTMNGAIGLTPTGFYVWGVNRGAGTPGFLANGINGVRFDRVILLRPDGTATIPGVGDLPGGSVSISGNTITGTVSGASLPSTGFAKLDYTWNLWPRDGAYAALGFAAISDFAPNNADFTTTPAAVPEPESYAMLIAGLGLMGWLGRRRIAART